MEIIAKIAAITTIKERMRRIKSKMPTLQTWVDAANIGVAAALALSFVFGVAAIALSKRLGTAKDEQYAGEKRTSDERISAADARAAEANASIKKSNEEIARLTNEAEQAKAERAEADKQIAIAKADAARAKEGIANAEARSLEASVEVSRLRITVANAEKERAKAEKSLLELQNRLADRVITDADAKRIIEQVRQYKGREFQVVTYWDDREPLATAERLANILVAAGWKIDQPKTWTAILGGLSGIQVFFHPEASPEARQAAEALVSALNAVGLSAALREQNDPGHPTEKININLGTKPR
jgi:hypothetical protein